MTGLVPVIHAVVREKRFDELARPAAEASSRAYDGSYGLTPWTAGTSPAMTWWGL